MQILFAICLSDVLLCHDDELDNRAIAFVLYLVPPWNKKDGGALDLFDMDGKFFHHQFLLWVHVTRCGNWQDSFFRVPSAQKHCQINISQMESISLVWSHRSITSSGKNLVSCTCITVKLLTFASSTGSWNLKRRQITFVCKRLVSRRPTIPKTALCWTQNATKTFWRFISEHACSTILCKFQWIFHDFVFFFRTELSFTIGSTHRILTLLFRVRFKRSLRRIRKSNSLTFFSLKNLLLFRKL